MKKTMSSAAQPEISIFTTAQRVWEVESAKELPQHQSGVVPEGPAAVHLGKDLRMSIRLKSCSGKCEIGVTCRWERNGWASTAGVLTDE